MALQTAIVQIHIVPVLLKFHGGRGQLRKKKSQKVIMNKIEKYLIRCPKGWPNFHKNLIMLALRPQTSSLQNSEIFVKPPNLCPNLLGHFSIPQLSRPRALVGEWRRGWPANTISLLSICYLVEPEGTTILGWTLFCCSWPLTVSKVETCTSEDARWKVFTRQKNSGGFFTCVLSTSNLSWGFCPKDKPNYYWC